MESRTEFNIEQNIEEWKSALSGNPNMTADNINELESHLLDEITGLQKSGLNEEESFLIAQKRMGSIDNLINEFNKVNRKVYFRNKILPYLNGILLFFTFITITELFMTTSILITQKIGINDSYLNLVSIAILIFLTIVLFVFIYFRYKNDRLNIGMLKNIPLLVAIIIISKILSFSSLPLLTKSIDISNFAMLQMNLNIYKLSLIVIVLAASCIVFYSSKKENKIKIAE